MSSVGHCFVSVLLYVHRNRKVLLTAPELCWALFRFSVDLRPQKPQGFTDTAPELLGALFRFSVALCPQKPSGFTNTAPELFGALSRFCVAFRPQKPSGLFRTGRRAQDGRLDFPTQLLVELCGHC